MDVTLTTAGFSNNQLTKSDNVPEWFCIKLIK